MVAVLRPDVSAAHSPLFSFFEAWFTGMDTLSRSYQPVLKGLAQSQLEIMGFCNRRVQAYAQIPGRLAQCRTPQEVFAEQLQFWKTAVDQYNDSSRTIAAAMSAVTRSSMATIAGEGARAEKRVHDYITFVDPRDDSITYQTRRDRKVA